MRFRRRAGVLSGCIAVLAATALVAAGARGDGDGTSTVATEPRGETNTTFADDRSASTTTSTDAAEGAPPASTTTTSSVPAGAGPTSTIAGATRGPFEPPVPGSYRYQVELDGSTRETRVTYAELSRRDGETRLSEQWDDPADQPAELLWSDEGVFVLNADSCDEPGQRTRYVFPLSVGAEWASDNTCSNERTGEIHTRSNARVTEFTKISVAGRSVDAWVISTSGTTDITIAGVTQTHHIEATEWFSAAHGLRVKSIVQMRQATSGASGASRRSTSEILNLDPE